MPRAPAAARLLNARFFRAWPAPLALAALALPACAPTVADDPLRSLVVAVAADVTGLYPHVRNESFTYAVNANVYEGLTALDGDLRVLPALSDRWENPDERTWVFHLRPGVRFSTGERVRVEDVVASLRHACDTGATRYALGGVASIDALGSDQVRLTTRRAAPTLLTALTLAYVIPAAELASPASRAAAGTGPYLVEGWERGKELVLRRNAHHRAPGGFESLRFRVIPDASARAAALRRGEVHIADSLPAALLATLAGEPGFRVVSKPSLRVLFLAMRLDRPPFDDPRVRQAIDLALDRAALIERALSGHGSVASQVVPVAVAGHNPSIQATAPDLARARELLVAAGQGALRVRLDGTRNRYRNDVEILHEVQRQLAGVGVQATPNPLDKVDFFELLENFGSDLYLMGWSCGGNDAGSALGPLFHTPAANGLGFENSQRLSSPTLDRLIEEADATADPLLRQELLQAGVAIVARERLVLPLVVQHESVALSRDVVWEPPLDFALRLHGATPAKRARDR